MLPTPGPATRTAVVTITFTYTGTTTSNGYAAIYYGLYVAKPGEVPDQGSGKTNGANAWTGGSLQTTVEVGGSGATSIQLMPSAVIAGEISGLKFNDLNRNGTKDSGEPGLANWTICLDDDVDRNNGDLGCVTTSDGTTDDQDGDGVTDPVGFYYFSVTPGTYYVYEVNQDGWTQTAPSAVYYGPLVVSAAVEEQTYLNRDFGNARGASLDVEKETEGGTATFGYTVDGSGLSPFNRNTATNNPTQSSPFDFTESQFGTKFVTETTQSGWTLTNIVCTASGAGITIGTGTGAASTRAPPRASIRVTPR